jgi:hypothetical protein
MLAVLPLAFTGKAMLTGSLYGPADLYYGHEPWKRIASAQGITGIANPILSDVSFQGFPWRAAVFEAARAGKAPLWNRFLLAGNPLLGSAQAGVFHPSTWLSLLLPLPLSFTFSATFTIFLSLLCAFLFFADFGLSPRAATVGALGWSFSTLLLFWNGYAEGLTLAALPFLLLGLRRLARERDLRAAALTVAALLLSLAGGQPEMFLFSVATGGIVFLWGLSRGRGRDAVRAVWLSLLAGGLALLLSAPLLLPVLEAIRNSSEYRARSQRPSRQSVSAREAFARLLPAVLPFSHGIYGKSPVQAERKDGSGMPFAYAGSVLFPLAALALSRRRTDAPGRGLFLALAAAGLLLGASAPGVMDLVSRLPGFALAHNYRLVFLAALGLSGLAALGAAEAERSPRALAAAAALTAALLSASCWLARGVFEERDLPGQFVRGAFAAEITPVVLLAVAAAASGHNGRRVASLAAILLTAQRAVEMHRIYPTLAARTLAPTLPTLAALPRGQTHEPFRVVAAGDVFRPNASALYGLEDVRGYESITLDRFVDTYPLWCRPQWASFNLVERLDLPFLSFLNVRYAIASPEAPPPAGWVEKARGPEMALFENPRGLGRAFPPRRLGFAANSAALIAAMQETADFGEICWLSGDGPAVENGRATLSLRAEGPEPHLDVDATDRTFVATSVSDWPGWRADVDGRPVPTVTVNHAFVGFWLAPGKHEVRLAYRPASFRSGLLAFGAGIAVAGVLALSRRFRFSADSPEL